MPSTELLHWISFGLAFLAMLVMAVMTVQGGIAGLQCALRGKRAKRPALHVALALALCVAALIHGALASLSSNVDAFAVYAFGWIGALCFVAAFVIMTTRIGCLFRRIVGIHYALFIAGVICFFLHGIAAHLAI